MDGFNIHCQPNNAFQSLGYCPQSNALWEDVTIREHLICYGLIKGVPMNEIKRLIERYIFKAFSGFSYIPIADTFLKISYCLVFFKHPFSYGKVLKITDHLDKRIKHCSGGTKRKLSFLISMIGDSSIIIMDEPSSGMDPYTRRLLW